MDNGCEIVWFKRDLRLTDHAPLQQAVQRCQQRGHSLVLLYCIEPELWQQPDMAHRHWLFIRDCLAELAQQIQSRSLTEASLLVAFGSLTDTLHWLHHHCAIQGLWSHQETGNDWTFQRDRQVQAWCREHRLEWFEVPQHAVRRGGINRDDYEQFSQQFFDMTCTGVPALAIPMSERVRQLPLDQISDIHAGLSLLRYSGDFLIANPSVRAMTCISGEQIQRGGRSLGLQLLDTFVASRSHRYLQNLARPLQGATFSSRLSPHLAWGSLSAREVMACARHALVQADDASHRHNLQAFISRLHWQSHFMQKLEAEPAMEFVEQNRLYRAQAEGANRDGEGELAPRLTAWFHGQTGQPMIDACMRCLRQTGWLPFRMRAMVMSYASYLLWLPWQRTAPLLATLFTDYEPGIHYPQIQMQSGVTGINPNRIYNPVKQSLDQDPHGHFIARFCPELASLPASWRHHPALIARAELLRHGLELGVTYPPPLVDHEAAAQRARQRLAMVHNNSEHRQVSRSVYEKHGSRRRPAQRHAASSAADVRQLSLF
ncbi:FAD-binding domain-containing protein [Pokkaliibacter sp. MBI-7]|uniref:cryptochrome/deoxyribodipyrimidine photo-lyase family protein n=1 Tax=Pokkaliibacter sp. MBI-7 TaxID=3040600 RepID=UPI00244C0E93|nr:FAD-binding domain-containing protein [Pokkaliibacter sp. MBI-7]MDH2436159.1 FAD-binding domain-containing protein [Pokkaliibacter sp. MBI-7]